ncbi:hypothetical protein M8C21_031441, partial [Ambrosia artemisiifolia]
TKDRRLLDPQVIIENVQIATSKQIRDATIFVLIRWQPINMRLEAQKTDYKKVVMDLEAARTKIKMLKRTLKSEAEQKNKRILDFHQRVQKMQEDENKHVCMIDPKFESELQKLKGLEAEIAELRKSNDDLQLERIELAHRLDCVQILATAVLEDAESEKVKEENQNLKKQNEDLTQQIEILQADRCADVEELVYLRWINACLRYELRNYQPGPGKTTARDLNKNLSPKSEEKAKQLILDYANKEDGAEKGLISLQEIDSDQWSNSEASIITSSEFDDSFVEDTLPHKNNKFFGKLMHILRGKDTDKDKDKDKSSCWSPKNQRFRTPSVGCKKIDYSEKDGGGLGLRSCSVSTGGKSELVKYAEALKDSRTMSNFKSYRRTPSL